MAIPTSPSVVVLENDVSIYTPNINSSVVGLVGFANKGPTDKATLITSQENLLRVFGKPDSNLEGQGLEGALEILEATNQLYFVRSVSSALAASAAVAVGACPAVKVEGYTPATAASSIYYSLTDNAATTTVTGTVELVSSTSFGTSTEIFQNAFNPDILNDQPIFSYVDGSDIYLASRYAGSGASLHVSAADSGIVFSALNIEGNASATGGSSVTTKGFTSSSVTLDAYSVYPGDRIQS